MAGNWLGCQHTKASYIKFNVLPEKVSGGRFVKQFFTIGSANWTLSSTCNREISVLEDATDLPSRGYEVRRRIEEIWNRGVPFTADRAAAASSSNNRSRSVGPTQRRFQAAKEEQRAAESSGSRIVKTVCVVPPPASIAAVKGRKTEGAETKPGDPAADFVDVSKYIVET